MELVSMGQNDHTIMLNSYRFILSVYSPFSDRVGLPLHNIHIPSPLIGYQIGMYIYHIGYYRTLTPSTLSITPFSSSLSYIQ